MDRVPPKNKCYVETLFEYRLDFLLHSLDTHEEQEVISIGTSKGTIINYSLKVDVLQCFDEDEMQQSSKKVIIDKDLNSDMIFYGKLDQVQSKIPTF